MVITVFSFVLVGLAMLYAAALIGLRAGLRKLDAGLAGREKTELSQDLPTVSIVVSARNEAQNLPRLISCLTNQDYPCEIIIVDDRSDDATWGILEAAAQEHEHLKALRVADTVPDFAPKKRALDLAIRSAQGEIILLTDADCSPPPTWARTMVDFYGDGVAGVVGYSPYRFDTPMPSLLKGMLALDYFSLFAVAAASAGLGRTLTASGTNLSYRKQTFLDAGGFESIKQWTSGDDDLFLHEVARKKLGKFVFALGSDAYVPAAAPTSWRQFWHQRIRYASKGRQYGAAMTAGLFAVYLFNLAVMAGIVLAALGETELLLPSAGVWVAKAIFEMNFLSQATALFRQEHLLDYFLPTALIHPLYILVFGFLGLFGTFRWKG